MTTLRIEPASAAVGVVVRGAALRNSSPAIWAQLRELLREHLLLVFPGQTLTDDDHVAIAWRGGAPDSEQRQRAR